MRAGAADLQCGVAVETVDSQNPSSYADYTSVCVRTCICAIMSDVSVRARMESNAGRDSAEHSCTLPRLQTRLLLSLEMIFINKLTRESKHPKMLLHFILTHFDREHDK